MSDIIQAIGDVRAMARQAQSLAQVVEVLDRLGSLENAESDINASISKAKATLASTKNSVAAASEKLKAAQDEADKIIADAKTTADAIVATAGDTANQLTAEAQAKVDALAASSTALQADFENIKQAGDKMLAMLDEQAATKQKVIADLDKKLDALRAKLG